MFVDGGNLYQNFPEVWCDICVVGVIVGEERWPSNPKKLTRVDLVTSAWSELRFQKGIVDVDIHFVPIQMRTEISMDVLVEGKIYIFSIFPTFSIFLHFLRIFQAFFPLLHYALCELRVHVTFNTNGTVEKLN